MKQEDISNAVRFFRQKNKKNMSQFAKEIGVSIALLSRFENNKAGISLEILLRMINNLNLRVSFGDPFEGISLNDTEINYLKKIIKEHESREDNRK